MNNNDFKLVSYEEYKKYVTEYPVDDLDYNLSTIFDPPMGNYNDFTKGKLWPESVVAYTKFYNKEACYDYKENEYYILK